MTTKTNNQLKKYIEAIENYEAEKTEIADRIKEIYSTAKDSGFNAKIMRKLIKIRKTPKSELEEEKYLLEVYADDLQMDLFEAVNNFTETVKDLEKEGIKTTISFKEEVDEGQK